jgi:glutathione S-transferase
MIIYGSTLSPFVRKVMVLAAEKGVAVELKQIGLGSTDPEFRAASPFGKIPALRDNDFTLADSSAIAHYIEALHPAPVMIPAGPRARATVVWFDEFADTILFGAAGKLFFNRVVSPRFRGVPGDLAAADKAEAEELPPIFDYIERVLPADAFLVGGGISLADIAVASPFANLLHAGCTVDAARWPALAGFVGAMLARPSFADCVARETRMLARLAAA